MGNKRSVTFHRMVTGVESIKMYVDDDIDLSKLTEREAHDIVEDAIESGRCFLDVELESNEYPHAVQTDTDYFDFSEYSMLDNG